MKLLLDESVLKRLGSFFPGEFEVLTVQQMGWTGSSNGNLLRLPGHQDFRCRFISTDVLWALSLH